MENEIKDDLLRKTDGILEYIDGLSFADSIPFSEDEVRIILEKEQEQAQFNYIDAFSRFKKEYQAESVSDNRRFVVYWGYPGAGKSFMQQKLKDRFEHKEKCQPFLVIDKDQYRTLFPNLFNHLKDGHWEECEKFAGVTVDYVRQILDFSIRQGNHSILSIGSMGAASEFKENAEKAIEYGFKPCAVYMSVNPNIAYLSSVYRSCSLYDRIIFRNEECCPRPVPDKYISGLTKVLPQMIEKIDTFQRENSQNVDLMVVNRENLVLYDSRKQHLMNIQDVITQEENRILNTAEVISINKQLEYIERNIKYRCENNIYVPYKSEADMTVHAVNRIADVIRGQGGEGNLIKHYYLQDNIKISDRLANAR